MRKLGLVDACNYITLRDDGYLEYESIFAKEFDGDLKLLLSCVEDNIINDATINWPAVERDYRISEKMRDK